MQQNGLLAQWICLRYLLGSVNGRLLGLLGCCGITNLLAETSREDVTRYLPLANQVQYLLSPAEMGELFKVIALRKGLEKPLQGFARGDLQHRL